MVGLSVLSVEAGALITRARCVAATAEITEISRCACTRAAGTGSRELKLKEQEEKKHVYEPKRG